jgi:hypothetical protein
MRKEISFLIIAFMLFSFPLVLAHGDVDDYYDDHHNNMMVLFIAWMIKQLQKK